jgi:hypothetical protein
MSHHAAKSVLDLAIRQIGAQNELLKAIEGQCSPEAFAAYRRAIAECAGTIIFELINPVVAQYPDLNPTEESWIATASRQGELIATRQLTLQTADGQVAVPIRIYQPEGRGGDWRCRYEIAWPDETAALDVAGFDATQALVLALCEVGMRLYDSEHHKSGHLSWEPGRRGYGFPVLRVARDQLDGDDLVF